MALPAWSQPHCEAEAKGCREGGYLSTMRSRCRFFCLSWLFLPACTLCFVWPLSSWAFRDPMGTKDIVTSLTPTGEGRPCGL